MFSHRFTYASGSEARSSMTEEELQDAIDLLNGKKKRKRYKNFLNFKQDVNGIWTFYPNIRR